MPEPQLTLVGSEEFVTAKPTVSVVYVTPEMAARWLDRNINNRTIRMVDVRRWARDMAEGKWQLTGEPIKFSADGRLLDGQNRLHAITKSGCTIALFVARGIPDEAQSVMDTGRKRTAADALAMRGEKNTAVIAAATRIALMIEDGASLTEGGYEVSHPRVLAFVEQHPDVRNSADLMRGYARRTDCPPAMVVYTHWRLSKIDLNEATQFWIDAADKVGLKSGDAALALSARLAEARRIREQLPREALLSLIYRAWNFRRSGTTVKALRINSPGKGGGLVAIPEPK